MKHLVRLFSLVFVLSLVALAPSQAQTVTLAVTIIGGPAVATQTVQAVGGVAEFTFDGAGCTIFTAEVLGSGGDVGSGKVKLNHKQKNVIEVAPQAVQAHLNHGDTVVPVGSTATVTYTVAEDGTVTVQVSGVTGDVQVNLSGMIVG